MDPLDLLLRQAGGFATTEALARAGFGSRALKNAVDDGRALRVRRGVYAVADTPVDHREVVTMGGRLAGLSAGVSYGFWDGWDDRVHVLVRRNASTVPPVRAAPRRTASGAELVVHWGDDRRDTASIWRVSVETCLRQVSQWHDSETATAVVESALRAGAVTPSRVARIASGLPPGSARMLLACTGSAHSGLETIARLRFERIGLVVQPQAGIRKVGRVDLRIVGTRVLVEIDGFEYHRELSAFTEDRRRSAESSAQGLVTLRFTAGHIRWEWPWVERMVLEAIAAAA